MGAMSIGTGLLSPMEPQSSDTSLHEPRTWDTPPMGAMSHDLRPSPPMEEMPNIFIRNHGRLFQTGPGKHLRCNPPTTFYTPHSAFTKHLSTSNHNLSEFENSSSPSRGAFTQPTVSGAAGQPRFALRRPNESPTMQARNFSRGLRSPQALARRIFLRSSKRSRARLNHRKIQAPRAQELQSVEKTKSLIGK